MSLYPKWGSLGSLLLSGVVMGCGPSGGLPAEDTSASPGDGTTVDDDGAGPTGVSTAGPPGASTSSPTGLDTGTDSSSGVSFIADTEGPVCVISEGGFWHCPVCDMWAQDCPADEKCMPWANDGGTVWNAARCVPVVDDPAAPDEACTVEGSPTSGLDSCDVGGMCWGVDPETLEGTCVAMCTGSERDPQCRPSASCVIANDGVIVLCLPHCSPLLGDCGPVEQCLLHDDAFVCLPAGDVMGQAGDPCEYAGTCEPGLSCEASASVGLGCDPAQPGCCTPWCDLSQADPDAACLDPAQQCTSWWGELPPVEGLESLGVCVLPPT